MASFHIDNRLKASGDVALTYNFELEIPQINKLCESIKNPEDLLIKVRSASIPSRGIEPITSYFMGMRQFFAGRPTFSDSLTVVFEEFQDQAISKALYEWSQKIFNADPKDPNGGSSEALIKRQGGTGLGYSTDIYLRMYNRDGTVMPKQIRFYNAWPSNIGEVGLDMGASDSIKYNVVFQFDYFTWEKV